MLVKIFLLLLLFHLARCASPSVVYLTRQTIREGNSREFRLDALSLVRHSGDMPDAVRIGFYKSAPPFAIESESVVVLHGPLDREQLCKPPQRPSPCADEDARLGVAVGGVGSGPASDCCVLLRLEARSAGSSSVREFNIRLDIEDVNDSPPVFDMYAEHSRSFSEGEGSAGQELRLPSATDADSVENGILEYRLADKRPNSSVFDSYFSLVDASGLMLNLEPKLRLIRSLDREQVAQFSFALLAVDRGRSQLTGSLSFTVFVTDINDHAPEIVNLQPGRRLRINETDGRYGKLTVATFDVVDPDFGENSRVACMIRSATGFTTRAERFFEVGIAPGRRHSASPVRSTNGLTKWELRSIGQLDYEEVRLFSFSIVASDSGSPRLSSSVSMTVELINIDDHPMQISFRSHGGQKQRVEVLENQAPGVTVASVEVRDRDIEQPSEYRRIECRLGHTSQQYFCLEEKPLIEMREFRLRTTVTFNRELQAVYQVFVDCRDMDSSATATATLEVIVGDLNDNPPLLSSAAYRGRVEENCQRRTLVAMETQIDAKDLDTYPNNQILYRIVSGDGQEPLPFSISAKGELYTEADLDFERRRSYTFNVTAYNQNNESQSSTAEVRIDVVDMNDNPPVIVGHDIGYRFSVLEEAAPLSVGFINATDEDTQPENRLLKFRILSPGDRQYGQPPPGFFYTPETQKYFTIDQRTGELRVLSRIDRETHPHFQFCVLVENLRPLQPAPRLGQPVQQQGTVSPSVTTVYVQVINVNDHPPRLCRQTSADSPHSPSSAARSSASCSEPLAPITIHFGESVGIAVGHAVREPKCVVFPYEVRDADDDQPTLPAEFTPRLENLTELVEGRLVQAPEVEFSLEGPQTLCLRRLPVSQLERQEFRMRLRLEDARSPGHTRSYECRALIVRLRQPPPPPPGATEPEGGRRNGAADQFAEAGAAADRRHFVIVVSLVTIVVFLIVFAFAFVLFFYVRRLDNSLDKDCEVDRCVTMPLKARSSSMAGGGGGGGATGGAQVVTLLYGANGADVGLDAELHPAVDYNSGLDDQAGVDFQGGRYETWRDQRYTAGSRQQQQQLHRQACATPSTGPTIRRVNPLVASNSCENVASSTAPSSATVAPEVSQMANYQTIDSHRYQHLLQQQQQQQQQQQSTMVHRTMASSVDPVYSPKKSLKNTYFETSFV